MTSLATLQREFQADVMGDTDAATGHVVGSSDTDVRARLDVYRHAYGARLVEVLAADFPALRGSLGPDRFATLAHGYVRSNPSRHRNVRWYGADFATFVAGAHDTAAGDLARLEWMLGLAFDAADAPVLTHTALATIPPEEWATVRLVAHPSAQRADLLSDTAPIWRRIQLAETAETIEHPTGTTPLVVWRKHLDPHFRSLDQDEAWAIDAILRGESFAAVCEGLCEWHDPEDAANRAATLLGNWIGDGLISSVDP